MTRRLEQLRDSLALLVTAVLIACSPLESSGPPEPVAEPGPSGAPGESVVFPLDPRGDGGAESLFSLAGVGIQHEHVLEYSDEDRWLDDYGGGMAAFDCDGDGHLDLYFTVSQGEDQLYRNLGDGEFEAESLGLPTLSGVSTAAAPADFDNDGDIDLLVLSQHSENTLLVNSGDCSFHDGTEEAGITGAARSVHAAWVDINLDGWLDVYITNWADPSPDGPVGLPPVPQQDRLWLGSPEGRFTDHTEALPAASRESLGMVAAFFDYDHDGAFDLLMSNDRGVLFGAHRLFRNTGMEHGNVSFEDVSQGSGFDLEMNGMGLGISDIDGDEDADILLTGNFETVLKWQEPGFYIESGLALGLNSYDPDVVSWAGVFCDPDLDGDEDIYIVQSGVFSHGFFDVQTYGRTPLFFRNDISSTLSYSLIEEEGVGAEQQVTRSLLSEDFDGDGVPDLVHGNVQSAPRILKTNPPEDRGALVVELEGVISNRDGRGSVVRVRLGDSVQSRWVGAVEPFGSGGSLRAYFGLGAAEVVDSVEVLWPSGMFQRVEQVPADSRIRLTEPS
jgi:hypothetical protein